MTIDQFLIRVRYTQEKPADVSAARWAGMLAWLKKRKGN